MENQMFDNKCRDRRQFMYHLYTLIPLLNGEKKGNKKHLFRVGELLKYSRLIKYQRRTLPSIRHNSSTKYNHLHLLRKNFFPPVLFLHFTFRNKYINE